jgi:hypothetical protein
MRIFLAIAIILSLAGQAWAQGKGSAAPGAPPAGAKSRQEIEAEKAAERAYKNSLGNIPDKPAADPWGGARSLEAQKAPPKATSAKPAKIDSPAK